MSAIKVPYILKCMVTGVQKSYTSVDFVQRKIENYGGDEAAMVAGYVCKDAKKALKLFDLEKLTVDDVKGVIAQLGGTADAQTSFDLIKAGKLFLTKKVKVKVKPATETPATETKTETTTEATKPAAKKTVKTAVKKSSKKKAVKLVPETPAADTTATTEAAAAPVVADQTPIATPAASEVPAVTNTEAPTA